MKGRLGAQAAVTATAHKLARIVYLALKHGMTYVRKSQEEYEAQMKEEQLKAFANRQRIVEPERSSARQRMCAVNVGGNRQQPRRYVSVSRSAVRTASVGGRGR
jgi:Cdc6-like AAA superfamily ATPase